MISEARRENFQKSYSLKNFYSWVNDCLLQLDDHVLPILQKYFDNNDIFEVLETQAQRLGGRDYKILVAGNWHFILQGVSKNK